MKKIFNYSIIIVVTKGNSTYLYGLKNILWPVNCELVGFEVGIFRFLLGNLEAGFDPEPDPGIFF